MLWTYFPISAVSLYTLKVSAVITHTVCNFGAKRVLHAQLLLWWLLVCYVGSPGTTDWVSVLASGMTMAFWFADRSGIINFSTLSTRTWRQWNQEYQYQWRQGARGREVHSVLQPASVLTAAGIWGVGDNKAHTCTIQLPNISNNTAWAWAPAN